MTKTAIMTMRVTIETEMTCAWVKQTAYLHGSTPVLRPESPLTLEPGVE